MQASTGATSGSSPHVRGALWPRVSGRASIGIIPACAGSTGVSTTTTILPWDHPRMCGEHWSQCRVCAPVEGSSPHVRGALVSSFIKTIQCGIIPACAGSTLGMGNWCRFRWDHPRMCGEHKSMAFCVGTLRGSSPHVRGALVWSCPYCGHSGIIPACAGSTRYSTTGKQGRRDHPRMCGEHTCCVTAKSWAMGSSPHVRGAHAMTGEKTQVYGIIPACAGSTRPNLDCPRLWGDHPRMYGEHDNQQPDAYRPVGSSPHVRGALR